MSDLSSETAGATAVGRDGNPVGPESLENHDPFVADEADLDADPKGGHEHHAGPDLHTPAAPSTPQRRSRLRAFFGLLGPGLVTGAADDDPSGVATYSQAGAAFGNQMLWTAPVSLPMMYLVQEICDRTALATGDSLGTLARRKFSHHGQAMIALLVFALIVANTFNIAADLAAIGQGMELLHLGPDHIWATVAGVGLFLALVVGTFERISSIFKWLCLVLLSYVIVLAVAHVDWAAVGRGTLGLDMKWTWASAALLVGVLGTTISPYMFFWQSAHRIEEMRAAERPDDAKPISKRSKRAAERKLLHSRIDVFAGMFVSTLVMYAIMIACSATLGAHGGQDIGTAADAAKALEPAAGKWASMVFALGFIGTGMLAVPVLAASGSVALAGLLNKNWGFAHNPRKAPLFYGLLALGTVGGIVIAWLSANPMQLLVLSAIINGIAAAPFLVVTMLIAGDERIMGDHRNGPKTKVLGWLVTAIMAVAGVVGLYVTLTGKG